MSTSRSQVKVGARRGALTTFLTFVLVLPLAAEESSTYGILPASVVRNDIALDVSALAMKHRWQRLVCATHGCELRSVELRFNDQLEAHKVYVSYSRDNNKGTKDEFTVALIGGNTGSLQRSIPTWFTRRTLRNLDDVANGSLGVTIRGSEYGEYRLIPRWNSDSKADSLTLYLESQRQRQRLGQISLQALEADLRTSDILIWAGDMDGDGRIDLITRVGERSSPGGLYLWLSSVANNKQMVGLAASLDTWTDIDEAEGC